MLPDVLSHKYGRYKEDTNKFITWLVDTAKNYGHVTPSPVLALATSTPRLKGRARKDAQKTASMSKNMGWEVRGKVSLQDIIDLAKTIVGNSSRKDPLQVPQYMLKIARNAIDARRKFVEWFQTQVVDQPALEENNKRHPYFVQILEEALALLTPYVMASLKENAVPVQPVSSIIAETPCKTLNNLFNNLEMDDSQDHDLLGAATIDVQDLESSEAEIQFAIFCILQDVHSVQDFVVETWQHYKSGEVDLVIASISTNTAINFVHDAEEKLMASYPQLTDYLEMLNVFYPLTKQLTPRMEHASSRPDAHGFSDHDFDAVEYLYTRPYFLLETFRDQVRTMPSAIIVSSKKAGGGAYNTLADRSQMCIGQKDKEDLYVLHDVLPEVWLLTENVIPAEDKFSRVVFAYRIYLDIHRTLREQVGRGFEELRVAKIQVKATLKDYFENEKSLLNDGWPEYNAESLHELDEIFEE
ncbi:MAG: hypothetical protein ASARMPREDX12_009205 [Alectoria sarmentosa]|nr:MAG: hypothetical protein ASARMPREDX12_009205 [Alectoria sarmentosa]